MKSTIRFTTKMGHTARPSLHLAGGLDYLRKAAMDALAIHDADTYTFSIEHNFYVYHHAACSGKCFEINPVKKTRQ